ncbi:MAG: hypothetical protein LBF05_01475, partial [Tannerella sp.]|nr:hypothetical protein [Tannerella sp.]
RYNGWLFDDEGGMTGALSVLSATLSLFLCERSEAIQVDEAPAIPRRNASCHNGMCVRHDGGVVGARHALPVCVGG